MEERHLRSELIDIDLGRPLTQNGGRVPTQRERYEMVLAEIKEAYAGGEYITARTRSLLFVAAVRLGLENP